MSVIAVNPDSLCGGVLITPSQGFFTIKGKPVLRNGDAVLPHEFHIGIVTVSSRFFTCSSIPVTLNGDPTTCPHPVVGGEYATCS